MSLSAVQQRAAQTVQTVVSGHNLTDVLTALWAKHPQLTATEKGAIQDLVYGSLRFRGLLLFLVRHIVRNTPPAAIECLLHVALYQLQFTRNAPHAIVNEAVAAAAHIAGGRYKNLVNAVLRRFQRERQTLLHLAEKNDSAQYNLPDWWLAYLRTHYLQDWHNIIAAWQQHPPMSLRVNRRHHTAESYLALLTAAGLNAQILSDYALILDKPVAVATLPGFKQGWVSVQDFGAQQAIPLLNPQQSERILDACAAPGGKTGHLLEWADVHVTALDIDERRLRQVADNLQRLRLSAQLHCVNAQNLDAWYDGQNFDAILADVPCTASGVVKRHPDIKWLRRPQDAETTARQQQPLLDVLWSTLATGGRMLLATCSIFHAENQQQLHHFLDRHSDAHLRESHNLIPNNHQDGFFYALIDKI